MSDESAESSKDIFRRVFDLGAESAGPPVVRLAHLILEEFLRAGAQQLRLTQGEHESSAVRFLIDGQWRDMMKIPSPAASPLANCYKVMASLDIARRPAQQGQLRVRLAGRQYELGITSSISPSGVEDLLITIGALGL